MAGYSGIQSNGKVGGFAPPDGSVSYSSGEFAPYKLPITYGPIYGPAGQNLPGQDVDDCQAGQNGYPLGQRPLPGQADKQPRDRCRGPARQRVARRPCSGARTRRASSVTRASSNRQPLTWENLP